MNLWLRNVPSMFSTRQTRKSHHRPIETILAGIGRTSRYHLADARPCRAVLRMLRCQLQLFQITPIAMLDIRTA